SCDHVHFVGEEGENSCGSAIVCMNACFGAPRDCKSSMLELEKVKRQHLPHPCGSVIVCLSVRSAFCKT
ncbi:MAG: hypothetical protein PWP09_1815, partial [Thermotogota bacterium]|nr:hypothetical protein [Thermotogota bacterium]